MGWHCSWVSAPKRSAKIISAQIKLWPLPGRPRISAPLICLSNETPAHREPSGSPPHTTVKRARTHRCKYTQTLTQSEIHTGAAVSRVHTLAGLSWRVCRSAVYFSWERESGREPRGPPSSSEPPKLTPCHHHSSTQSPLPKPIWIIYTLAHKLTPIHLINLLPTMLSPYHKLLSLGPRHRSLLRSYERSSVFSLSIHA